MDAMRVARYDDTTPYYFHNDHLGRSVALTDAAGAIAWQVDYLPFGKVYTVVNNTTDNELGFPGQILDAESGFFYNYFRDYDPETGRYVQSDPIGVIKNFSNPQLMMALEAGLPIQNIGFDGELNYLYGYAEQNALNKIDPFGLIPPSKIPGHGCASPRQSCLDSFNFFSSFSLVGAGGTFLVKSTASFILRKGFGVSGGATFAGAAFCYNLSDKSPCDDCEK